MSKQAKKISINHKLIDFKERNNSIMFLVGLLFLLLAKIKNILVGYVTARTFPVTEYKTAVEHDKGVVDRWMQYMDNYSGDSSLKDKTVLELGPGADLGVGLLMLAMGAKKYNALDINNLVEKVPENFYIECLEYIRNNITKDVSGLKRELKSMQSGSGKRLNYIWNKDFDVTVFKDKSIDVVFSQAAFEHFDDVENTVVQLGQVVKEGSLLVAQVDLKTHSRWIRIADPLNIYRYPESLYRIFRFSGVPNRLRPYRYQRIIEEHGWDNVTIYPLAKAKAKAFSHVKDHLTKKFQPPVNQMDNLSIMICATKS